MFDLRAPCWPLVPTFCLFVALSAILEDVNRNGVPDLTNRNASRKSRDANMDVDLGIWNVEI